MSTALIVGDDRAVAAARAGMGEDAIVDALPYLQTGGAQPRDAARPQAPRQGALARSWPSVRAAAAAAAGTEEPPLQQLYRVSGTNLLMAVGTLIAVFALLEPGREPEELWDTITSADWSG